MKTNNGKATTIEDLLTAIGNSEWFTGDDTASVQIFSDGSGSVFIHDHAHDFNSIERMFSILCEK